MQLLVTLTLVGLFICAAIHAWECFRERDWLGGAVSVTALVLLWLHSAWPL